MSLQAATAAGVQQADILAASTAPAVTQEAAADGKQGKTAEGGGEGGAASSSSSSDSYSEFEEEPLDKNTLDKANLEGAAAALAFATMAKTSEQPPPPPPPPQ